MNRSAEQSRRLTVDELNDFRADLPITDATRMGEARAALELAMNEECLDAQAPDQAATGSFRVRRWRPAAAFGVVGAVAALVLAVSSSNGPAPEKPSATAEAFSETTPIQYGEALLEFPNDTAADVVSRANQVSVMTAVSSAPIPTTGDKAQQAAGEGLVLRRMVFHVDRTLWTAADGAESFEGTFTSLVNGWVLHNFKDTRFAIDGTAWPEEGAQYVAPIIIEDGKPRLELPAAIFPLIDSEVTPAPTQETPLAKALTGDSESEIAHTFKTAEAELTTAGGEAARE